MASIFSGGIFTIILVPVAVIAAVSAVFNAMVARAAGVEGTGKSSFANSPIRRRGETDGPGEVPATPNDYVKALQRFQ